MTIKQVAKLIDQEMKKQHIPAVSLAVVQGETPLLLQGFGFANVEHNVSATPETVYEIASITKLFTATAIMLLVEDGRLALTDPLAAHLPNLPLAWSTITIQHVLTHQSGLHSYTETAAYWETTRLDISQNEILALVADLPLNFLSGQKQAYDNTGFYLLGLLIEAVAGKPYDQFLHERIFAPLGMTATRVNDPYQIVPQRAAGYSFQDGQLKNAEYYSPSGTFSAGVLLSSVSDLARWAATLHTDRLLRPESQQLMWTPHLSAMGNEKKSHFALGLGWFIVDYKGRQFVGHNGSIIGFNSSFIHFIDRQLTVILLCNSDTVTMLHDVAFQVAALFDK